jgi:hypothetical protein
MGFAGPTEQLFGELLARWAEGSVELVSPQGGALGWENGWAFGPNYLCQETLPHTLDPLQSAAIVVSLC